MGSDLLLEPHVQLTLLPNISVVLAAEWEQIPAARSQNLEDGRWQWL